MRDPVGRPQGGFKSESGKAAYWRMQYESAIGALADLIAEHTETVEMQKQVLVDLRAQVEVLPGALAAAPPDRMVLLSDVLALIDGSTDGHAR